MLTCEETFACFAQVIYVQLCDLQAEDQTGGHGDPALEDFKATLKPHCSVLIFCSL